MVAGAFCLGLAAGGWISTRRMAGSVASCWRRFAGAEAAVALLALPAMGAASLAPLLASSAVPPAVLRIALPLLLVGLPAAAMGLVTPLLVRACTSIHPGPAVALYAANLVGAVTGVGAAITLLLPRLGTVGTGAAACSANLLIAGAGLALALHRRLQARTAAPEASAVPRLPRMPLDRRLGAAAFGSGFITLGAEVVLQFQFAQVTVSSHIAAGFTLALVLGGLGLGAAAAPLWLRLTGSGCPFRAVRWAALLAGAALLAQPALFHGLLGGVVYRPFQVGLAAYFGGLAIPGLGSVLLPFAAAGLVFPLLLRRATSPAHGGDARLAGPLLAWNGLGGWAGAEVAQAVLLPGLGLWGPLAALGTTCALVGALAGTPPGPRTRTRFAPWLLLPLGAAAWAATSGLPHLSPGPGHAVRALAVGREGVVAVTEGAPDDRRIVFNNSYTLGGSRAATNQERQAHLPLLLHGSPRTVATLGVATGSTASAALAHPSVSRVDAIELSPIVLDFARVWFTPFNNGLLDDVRVRATLADARWEILRHQETYDVVVGDLFLPWRTGEGRLFTREHFQGVRRSLAPGGLYCQWLPLYQLTEAQFHAISRTFRSVFPEAFIVRGDFYADTMIVGLVGGRPLNAVDWEAVGSAAARLRNSGSVRDPLSRHSEGVALLVCGPLQEPPPGPTITLDNASLEWDAGRSIIAGGTPWFTGVPAATLLRSAAAAAAPLLPPRLHAAHAAGQFFGTLAIADAARLDSRRTLAARIPDFLPHALASDAAADWSRWPAFTKPSPAQP